MSVDASIVEQFNPIYVQYARVHGESDPRRMLERDRETWPGGLMTGFLIWNAARRAEWEPERRRLANTDIFYEHIEVEFRRWLETLPLNHGVENGLETG